MEKDIKVTDIIKLPLLLIILCLFSFVINENSVNIIYIKTNGIINEMKIISKSNYIKNIYNQTNLVNDNNNVYKKEIETQFGDQIIIDLLKNKNDRQLSVGILLQIESIFYELKDSNFTVSFDSEEKCDEYIDININDTYIKQILYCHIENTNETLINIVVPFSKYYYNNNRLLTEYTGACNPSCLECDGPYSNNCTSCNNTINFYLSIDKHSCIKKDQIPLSYFLDLSSNTIKKCHKNCFSCNGEGTDDDNNCVKCKSGFHTDEEKNTTCIEGEEGCPKGCADCFDKSDSIHGIISQAKLCKLCSENYSPLQQQTGQFYVICYPNDSPPKGYFLNGGSYKACYETCDKCQYTGDSSNHKCEECAIDFRFVEEEPNNCLPKCAFFYYYTKYGQYKCTIGSECPREYPYFILEKKKCIDYCKNDNTYNLTYNNKCFQNCPDGTYESQVNYYDVTYTKCIVNNSLTNEQCNLENHTIQLEYNNITNEI